MPKATRGTTRGPAGKKKPKKRLEPRPADRNPPSPGAGAQPQTDGAEPSGGTVLEFRPRARETSGRATARSGGLSKALLQAVDYSYVYTDLRIIGALAAAIFGGLIVLSFVLR